MRVWLMTVMMFLMFVSIGSAAKSKGDGSLGLHFGYAETTGEGSEYWNSGFSLGFHLYPNKKKVFIPGISVSTTQFKLNSDVVREELESNSDNKLDEATGKILLIEVLPGFRLKLNQQSKRTDIYFQYGIGLFNHKQNEAATYFRAYHSGDYISYGRDHEDNSSNENYFGGAFSIGFRCWFTESKALEILAQIKNTNFQANDSLYYSITIGFCL